jgi:phosphatidylserine synthase
MRWNIGYFGVKDLFTIINLLGGVGGIFFAIRGEIEYAGYAIFAGYLFGDSLDGQVARLTNTSNKFGGEFDSAADHIGQGIAPAVIVGAAYRLGGHEILGLALMALMIGTASIRQARFQVDNFNYPLTYCGLPRSISGLVAISLPNTVLFFEDSILGYEGAAGVLALVAILNLCPVPYMTHKGRRLQGYVRLLVATFFIAPVLLFIFARPYLYDFVFVFTFTYALGAWIPLTPTERREFWAEYKRWSSQVAAA